MDVDARVEALEAHIEKLEDEIEHLRGLLGTGPWYAPPILGLTGKESGVLGVLMSSSGVCTKEHIMSSVYVGAIDEEPQIRIVDVFVCKIRKKLAPFGIQIGTAWGRGYLMDQANKAKVRALGALTGAAA